MLVHDAARPLVTAALAEQVIAALARDEDADAAIAAVPVTDTVKRVDSAGARAARRSTAASCGRCRRRRCSAARRSSGPWTFPRRSWRGPPTTRG